MTIRRSAIGVFDSGFGGLTVLKALLELIPDSDYFYFGDTARLPYGSKSVETVAKYAVDATQYLEQQGAQLLVIACNTATALALGKIETQSGVPVVGVIEPGAESASKESKNQKVVVIGTEATVSSHAYQRALEKRGINTKEKACPLLVPLVEEGWIDNAVTEQVARIYLNEAFADGFENGDTLVLGCTHYPLIRRVLRKVAPDHVAIVDSAQSTAQVVKDMLGNTPLAKATEEERRKVPRLKFFATDSVEKFRSLGARFLGREIEDVHHVDLKE
ncbi:MAG: glutamate racemase [Terriglobales bacterium]|jgi:glutamate racemase|nr:glutamate racemase [Terriglobales bacterium]